MPDAQMPRYKCHKTVHALKILSIAANPATGGAQLEVEAPFGRVGVTEGWMMKHSPKPGGYYVVYADGYSSFSPAEAFEEGYALDVPQPAPTSDLENRFTYHKPIGDQERRYNSLRQLALHLAERIEQWCPASRERSLALTNLEQAGFWANASIARNEDADTHELRPAAPAG